MTTIRIYRSPAADVRLKARYGRKHGRPRGRGRKGYRLLYREVFTPEMLGREYPVVEHAIGQEAA